MTNVLNNIGFKGFKIGNIPLVLRVFNFNHLDQLLITVKLLEVTLKSQKVLLHIIYNY